MRVPEPEEHLGAHPVVGNALEQGKRTLEELGQLIERPVTGTERVVRGSQLVAAAAHEMVREERQIDVAALAVTAFPRLADEPMKARALVGIELVVQGGPHDRVHERVAGPCPGSFAHDAGISGLVERGEQIVLVEVGDVRQHGDVDVVTHDGCDGQSVTRGR